MAGAKLLEKESEIDKLLDDVKKKLSTLKGN